MQGSPTAIGTKTRSSKAGAKDCPGLALDAMTKSIPQNIVIGRGVVATHGARVSMYLALELRAPFMTIFHNPIK